MKTHDIPKITLNDGTTIPQLGFGTLNVGRRILRHAIAVS
jgi:diketogulonate reductase-like aldo/keto reductase